jgi:enoyl-CoA hydratase
VTPVDVEATGAVTTVRLNRPQVRNAMNYDLVGALHDALDEVAANDQCRVVVLTGAGDAFCAGLDLQDYGTPPDVGRHRHRHAGVTAQGFLANLTSHIRDTPQIVIAAVNGPAFGGGLALACACDLRFASESARFCSAFIRTGLSGTDVGITYFLPRLIGAARAFDMIVTGRVVDAAEAERMGLVSRVVPDSQLLDEGLAAANSVAGYTSFGLRRTKEVMWHNLDASSLAAAVALENRNQELGAREPEVLEYMRDYGARFRKRSPTGSE